MEKIKCSNLIIEKLSNKKDNFELTGFLDYKLNESFLDLINLMNEDDLNKFKELENNIYLRNNIKI